jgi:hypothetical protein
VLGLQIGHRGNEVRLNVRTKKPKYHSPFETLYIYIKRKKKKKKKEKEQENRIDENNDEGEIWTRGCRQLRG